MAKVIHVIIKYVYVAEICNLKIPRIPSSMIWSVKDIFSQIFFFLSAVILTVCFFPPPFLPSTLTLSHFPLALSFFLSFFPCGFVLFFWLHWVSVAAWRIFVVSCEMFSCSMWDLVPWSGIKPRSPALGVWSLNHWTTREVPHPHSHSVLKSKRVE